MPPRRRRARESDDENTLKILIATDNHVGFLETDPIRGKDSFRAFEEVLQQAQKHNVDLILLGGDLFHHNKPSQNCLHEVATLVRRYCFGDKPCNFWIASDQSINFANQFNIANVFDPNLNVSYPIFSIHGNHDDPAGFGNLCALDILSSTGLANYFGRCHDFNKIELYPILLQKGSTQVALYGLGNIRDERLHRAWRDGHVSFKRPREDGAGSEWLRNAFNVFVLHQNRARHGPTSHIPEEFLDEFLDLVIWGHEHECRIEPEHSINGFDITQPGSSVATSLAAGEALPKHIGLLKITGREYTLEPIRLRTVRPFQFTQVVLSKVRELTRPSDTKACQRYLTKVVEDLIQRANDEWQQQQDEENHNDESQEQQTDEMPLPLIRVRVDYSGGFETFNTLKFGQMFANRVANPKDILQFHRSRTTEPRQRRSAEIVSDASLSVPERLDALRVEDLVGELLGRNLELLPENELADVIQQFVEKDDKHAVSSFIDRSLQRTKRRFQDEGERGHVQDLSDDYVKRRATADKEHWYNAYAREMRGRTSQPGRQQQQQSSNA